MRRRSSTFIGLAMLAFLAGQRAAAQTDAQTDSEVAVGTVTGQILLLSEENPPFNYTDAETGTFTGPITAVVREMMGRADIPYRLEVHPWARSYRVVQATPGACVFMINPTEERRPKFEWIGPFGESGWLLYGRADFAGSVPDVAAAKAYKIGAPTDSGILAFLKQFDGLTVIPIQRQNVFAMLRAGRVDLLALGPYNAAENAARAGVAIRPVLMLQRSELSMACHAQTDADLLRRMRDALETIKADGTLRRLFPPPMDDVG